MQSGFYLPRSRAAEPSGLAPCRSRHAQAGPPTCRTTITLDDLGGRPRWRMVAGVSSLAEREAAVALGFTGPIQANHPPPGAYPKTLPNRTPPYPTPTT